MSRKFEYQEFSSLSVVETYKNSLVLDEKIGKVIASHLKDVINVSSSKDIDENEVPSKVPNKGIYSESDIEKLKNEFFEKGKEQAKKDLEENFQNKINEINSQNNEINELLSRLNQMAPAKEPIADFNNIFSEILNIILEKLCISILPEDKEILEKLFSKLLSDSYKGGSIVLRVNQTLKDRVEKLISESRNAKQFDNIELIATPSIEVSTSIIEYNDTRLIYDKSAIKTEIEEIINQFKQN
jgi:flagellar biosynthesis/type III secretory pathway protein FliH